MADDGSLSLFDGPAYPFASRRAELWPTEEESLVKQSSGISLMSQSTLTSVGSASSDRLFEWIEEINRKPVSPPPVAPSISFMAPPPAKVKDITPPGQSDLSVLRQKAQAAAAAATCILEVAALKAPARPTPIFRASTRLDSSLGGFSAQQLGASIPTANPPKIPTKAVSPSMPTPPFPTTWGVPMNNNSQKKTGFSFHDFGLVLDGVAMLNKTSFPDLPACPTMPSNNNGGGNTNVVFVPMMVPMLVRQQQVPEPLQQQQPLAAAPPQPFVQQPVQATIAETRYPFFADGSAQISVHAPGGLGCSSPDGTPCTHYTEWKRLRVKKGMSHFLCRECGLKWRSRR